MEHSKRNECMLDPLVVPFLDSVNIMDGYNFMYRLPEESVDAVIFDPPYCMNKADWDTCIPFHIIPGAERILKPGGAFAVFGLPPVVWDWLRNANQLTFARELYWWHDNGYPNQRNFRLATESILYLVKGDSPAYFGIDDVREPYAQRPERPRGRPDRQNPLGKSPGNVLRFPRVAPNHVDWADHPTVKPLGLMKTLVLALCPRGGVVCDPTCGSGTTLVAAKETGRHWIGIDTEEAYVLTARQRLAACRHNKAITNTEGSEHGSETHGYRNP